MWMRSRTRRRLTTSAICRTLRPDRGVSDVDDAAAGGAEGRDAPMREENGRSAAITPASPVEANSRRATDTGPNKRLTSIPATVSLGDLYQQRLAEHGFTSDAAQLAAVARLDDLRGRLIRAHASNGSSLRRWLARLSGNSTREPERGLYLWGGVGRGK